MYRQCELMIITFEVMAPVADCGSSSSIRIPSLKFVGLAIRKIIMVHDVCQGLVTL